MGPKYSILHKAFCEMAKICNLKENLKQIISQFFIKNPTWRPSTLEPESYKDTMHTETGELRLLRGEHGIDHQGRESAVLSNRDLSG